MNGSLEMLKEIERELHWFNKLEREGYYKHDSELRCYDALRIITRINKIVGNVDTLDWDM